MEDVYLNQEEAYRLYNRGVKPSYSTFIDELTITAGYGDLYPDGSFEFPLIVDQDTFKIVEKTSCLT